MQAASILALRLREGKAKVEAAPRELPIEAAGDVSKKLAYGAEKISLRVGQLAYGIKEGDNEVAFRKLIGDLETRESLLENRLLFSTSMNFSRAKGIRGYSVRMHIKGAKVETT